eukprot:TRINITY_DN2880_c2_g1_i1.p1 TRINITY_DN2880_c2_g1~~TRINITY_DN2880_c2_g1_i1.p1  ORF type:complete len:871 (+),score=164.26 TRINITY_DN2880_c2_g1_i1:114-2726(+)
MQWAPKSGHEHKVDSQTRPTTRVWIEKTDWLDNNWTQATWYVELYSGQQTYELPAGEKPRYRECVDSNGYTYYYDFVKSTSSWDPPNPSDFSSSYDYEEPLEEPKPLACYVAAPVEKDLPPAPVPYIGPTQLYDHWAAEPSPWEAGQPRSGAPLNAISSRPSQAAATAPAAEAWPTWAEEEEAAGLERRPADANGVAAASAEPHKAAEPAWKELKRDLDVSRQDEPPAASDAASAGGNSCKSVGLEELTSCAASDGSPTVAEVASDGSPNAAEPKKNWRASRKHPERSGSAAAAAGAAVLASDCRLDVASWPDWSTSTQKQQQQQRAEQQQQQQQGDAPERPHVEKGHGGAAAVVAAAPAVPQAEYPCDARRALQQQPFRPPQHDFPFMELTYLRGSKVISVDPWAEDHVPAQKKHAIDVQQAWVQLPDPQGSSHGSQAYVYWNYATHALVEAPPKSGWRFRREPDPSDSSLTRFIDAWTGEPTTLPGLTSTDPVTPRERPACLREGCPVLVRGVLDPAQKRYVGQPGKIDFFTDSNTALVVLPYQLGRPVVTASVEDLQPLPRGSLFEYDDGSTPIVGVVTSEEFKVSTEGRRMQVSCEAELHYLDGATGLFSEVPVNCIFPCSRLLGIDFGHCRDRYNEQLLYFVDSTGERHSYYLHLPKNFEAFFKAQQEAMSELPALPLLLWLHGAGGGSKFGQSKGSLRTPGIMFCADNFVVVSPVCEWKWKAVPPRWVPELFLTFRSARWIDAARMYVTGNSMGGMGAWEYGATLRRIAAAIAPTAAYLYHADRAAWLAEKLADMPILAVHSTADTTCPVEGQESFWRLIKERGNERMQIFCCDRVDHCSIWERVYCRGTYLYDWLLSHRRSDA